MDLGEERTCSGSFKLLLPTNPGSWVPEVSELQDSMSRI